MKVIDLHCDVLWRITTMEHVDFRQDVRLQANLVRLKQGNIKVQVFAIYVPPNVPKKMRFLEAVRQIEAFHTHILKEPEMVHITEWSQIEKLQEHEIGAVLSLEGCDAIGNDLLKLDALLHAGVKLVGLTWNGENEVAYGAEQNPNFGLKPFGEQVIEILNQRNIIVDVSHLNEQSFWDVLPRAKYMVASHSNARALCNHPRNLTDEQAKALVKRGGHIHVVYYPPFIANNQRCVELQDIVAHIRHFACTVGIDAIGLGSDFDGIEQTVMHLEHAGQTGNLLEALKLEFSHEEVAKIASTNFLTFVQSMCHGR